MKKHGFEFLLHINLSNDLAGTGIVELFFFKLRIIYHYFRVVIFAIFNLSFNKVNITIQKKSSSILNKINHLRRNTEETFLYV